MAREGGPAVENFDPESGNLTRQVWIYPDGVGKHSAGGLPTSVDIDPNTGVVTSEEYYDHGVMHRNDGPAETHRDSKSGRVTFTAYYKDGRIHRDGEMPALEFFSKTGEKLSEEYYTLGKRHRENGPAVIEFDDAGNSIPGSEEHFQHGERISMSAMAPPRPKP